jgi:hypothetical protein
VRGRWEEGGNFFKRIFPLFEKYFSTQLGAYLPKRALSQEVIFPPPKNDF